MLTLHQVVDIVDSMEGLFGLADPLKAVFGKKNVEFWGYRALIVKVKGGRKIDCQSSERE